jgi:hypothetical protein
VGFPELFAANLSLFWQLYNSFFEFWMNFEGFFIFSWIFS